MLVELYIKNLAVIEELRLRFDNGLTVLSGEEGAGKSLIVDALSLLLGERGSGSLIRGKSKSALVEGVFEIETDSDLETVLQEAGLEPESDGTLILTRELQAQGRTLARVNGRAVSVSLLRDLGRRLVDIHKQTENLSILDHQRQIELLDAFGGLHESRRNLGKKVAELRDKTRELERLAGADAERHRDLLEYQADEIERSCIEPGEDEALRQKEQILRRVETLRDSCADAYSKLYFDDQCASGLLQQAARALHNAAGIDPTLTEYLEELESAVLNIEEAARDLRRYADNLETSPELLAEVQGRLRLLRELQNKYGSSLEEVVAFGKKARQELQNLNSLGDTERRLEQEKLALEREAAAMAQELSGKRQKVALSLMKRVNSELIELGLHWASFSVNLRQEENPSGLNVSGKRYSYSRDGIDRVEFFGTTNPGVPLMPLAEIASGGETCRFMLALKSVLQQVDRVPTLVFDEVDSGVGGRSAGVIGKKLLSLAGDRQVIAITHQPQIACFGHRHLHVTKRIARGLACTRVEQVEGESRVQELAAMLGSRTNRTMHETAKELMSEAAVAAEL